MKEMQKELEVAKLKAKEQAELLKKKEARRSTAKMKDLEEQVKQLELQKDKIAKEKADEILQ